MIEKVVRNKVLERTLSGENTKMAIETLKNFDTSEINAKLGIMQDFSNEPEIIDKYIKLYKNGGQFNPDDENAKEYKKFFSKYEIIEPPVYDPKTGMSALVIGNKDTKEVEIIFGASQGPRNTFAGGEKGKRARQDWHGNNFKAPLITTGSQKAAKEFTEKIKKDYENHLIYNKGLVIVNGHSKAGGEAIYSTSFVPGGQRLLPLLDVLLQKLLLSHQAQPEHSRSGAVGGPRGGWSSRTAGIKQDRLA